MNYNGLLLSFPREIKMFIGVFVLVLSIGFFTGLLFVSETSGTSVNGIEENYLGNEDDDEAEVMKFKKGNREMLTIVHTHILSMSMIFFLLGGLVWLTKLPKNLKLFLTVEPLLSVVLTFGGIYLMWIGFLWAKYVVIVSGFFMTASFSVGALLVLWQLCQKPNIDN
ncbi:hypothetical protein HCG49_06795 [Arenibacter sp. 6A1]|uniref:hypothetical protein n=1 Tax=Arenibacter sp. 6A1 TaxID=2720391 RepID=UPI0014450416|nr:hypothetical protein [Arenibacter sp. 6A1]NKI26265.1 hypothetical protein [Arenibacter sp. 6A1]